MIAKKISESIFSLFSFKGSTHISLILIILNIFVFFLNVGAFYLYGQDSFYINREGIYLVSIIALQVHISLINRRLRSDPFVIILSFITIVYYCFRVFTLLIFNASDTFIRNEAYTSSDTTHTLYLIFLFNFFMLFAFYLVPINKIQRFKFSSRNYNHFIDTLLLFATLLLLLHMSGFWSYFISISRFSQAAFSLINIHWIIYFIFFILIKRSSLSFSVLKSHKIFILILLFIQSLWLIVGGSRGYLVFFIEIILIGILSLGRFTLNNYHLFKAFLLAPILLLSLYIMFMFASDQRKAPDITGKIEGIVENIEGFIYRHQEGSDEIRSNLRKFTNRIGYLDMPAEILSNKDKYEFIFSPSFYAKSFTDNLLTPGFDIFDTPKVSRSLYFVHQNKNNNIPSKDFGIKNDIHHSDMLTIYGEFFMIFSWLSLLIVFIFAYFLKWLYYLKFKAKDFGLVAFVRPTILLYFYFSLNSFGVDWIISTYIVPIISTIIILMVYHKIFFKSQ